MLIKAIALILLLACVLPSQAQERKRRRESQIDDVVGYSEEKNEAIAAKIYTIEAQPRMYTSGGHLFFQTATSYNISFKTDGNGKINLNEMDLTEVMNQVKENQADIEDIRQNGGGTVPQDLIDKVNKNGDNIANNQDQINDHNLRLDNLESSVATLQTDVTALKNQLNEKKCSSNPCKNDGTCINLYQDFFCQCTEHFQGPTCEDDVNECTNFASSGLGCQNGGTCVNSIGGFSCTCPAEYYGRYCTSKYDDCTDGSSKCQHGICVDSPREQPNVPKYTCVCEDGWQVIPGSSDPTCSQDVNECEEKPCSKNPEVPCYNNPGSYTCGACPNGFIGNGWACTDIDECATNNGGCSISPPVLCINTAGSSSCGPCPSGYTGDGKTCSAIDACAVNNGGCHPLATCTVNPAIGPSAVTCTCPNGYTGNGIGPNGCTLNPTDCTGSCQNGQCLNDETGQYCSCDPGWTGVNCDVNIDECISSPCQNGGTCIDGVNGYYCNCPNNYGGTNCQIDESGCGAYYRQESGSFSFPSTSGSNYPNGASCAWVIEVSLGKIIQVTFPVFDIESSTNCNNDFLQIHDGNSASAHQIGKYCGTTVPGNPLLSTHNLLYFWFRSNSQNSGKGFQVVWQPAEPECGEDITGATYGDITTPGYPGDYPANRDCFWTIHVQPGNVVQLLFGTLAIETHENCTNDYVEFRNGLLDTDPVLARYCSSITPPPLLSTAPGMWIHFHSDADLSDTGFHIVWSSQPVDITGCGGYLSEDEGIIISPNWPNPYEQNQECFWQIHIGPTGQILLNFTHMDIEGQDQCLFDFLEIRDGPDETSPLAARYCGQEVPPAYTSSTNDLWMKLKSDETQSGSGFRATYAVACGGTYTAESGSLVSPYYPAQYPNNKDCFYLIRQEPGHVITLTFEDFQIEHVASCNYDYIEEDNKTAVILKTGRFDIIDSAVIISSIRDGSTKDSPLLAKLCGDSVPVPVRSTLNYMWIHFATDAEAGASGFKANYASDFTGCGGVYTDAVGSLQSPGHPTPYPHGANCTYYIAVDPAFIINFQFIYFKMQEPDAFNNCSDYVEIFDGPDVKAPSLGRFCGSIPPPVTVSNGYTLTIYFSANADEIDAEGFAAAYTTINSSTACGKRLTDNQGLVSSPNYPENYDDARTCVWTLTVDPAMQIRVTFSDFVLEGQHSEGSCAYDYLELRNGGYDDSALIGVYCGTNSPGTFTTHGNQFYMKFHSDPFANERGFLMEYDGTLTGCGGTLTTADGYFQSPNYPFAYNHNAECLWLINVSEGSTVRLTFTAFDIETHGYCEFDYVEIYDGPTIGYPSLGRQCGSRLPPPYESSDNTMMVKFRTDANTAGTGFLAQYHVVCEREIQHKSSGRIQSLDFPGDYPPRRDCAWGIQATKGNKINVTFTYFAMETCDDCSCDYIEIIDYDPATSDPITTRYCGNQRPGPFTTSTDHLLVNFHTDPYIQAPGFEMVWAIDGCGDTLTAPTGVITSPNYPNNYDDNRECVWQIITSPGTSIQLTITAFDVEHHEACDYDVLEVYNGLFVDPDYQLAKLCNGPDGRPTLPMVVASTSTFMSLRFLTDALTNGKGFSANYEEVAGQCGGNLKVSSGSITSPNYPNPYGSMLDCEWYIDVGEGNTVLITFETFDIEPEPACNFDYVAIYDGYNASSVPLLKACGSSVPDPVQSSGHYVLFQFHSDPFSTLTGFKASFSSACGGRITVTQDGDLSSPNYPDTYPANTTCTWILQSPDPGGHVTVTFTHMDLYWNSQFNGTCGEGYDYIEVLDGSSLSSPLYSHYCQNSIPSPITSFSNAFTMTLVSQSLFQRTGFRALYSTSSSRCGGELTAQKGIFNSPNFPDPYPAAVTCTWIIRSSPGNGIHLHFLSFDIEEHVSCLFDYLQIREGSSDGPILAQLCGAEIPNNLTTVDGHVLYIIFRSDFSTVGKGFQAAYQHTYGSEMIGQFSGIIASPMYPGLYPDMLDVYYSIYAPAGRLIYYVFTLFDLQQATEEGCVFDYLSIYDGDTTDFPLLLLLCGNDILPPPQTTTQGAMLMWFHSDLVSHGRGFYMTWEAVDGEGVPPNPTNVPTIPPGSCGSNHMVVAVYPIYFFSPGFPDLYPENLDCIWVMESAPGYRVELKILYLDVESIGFCTYDFVAVYSGPNISSPEIGRYCGRNAPKDPILSISNFLTVRFKTDRSIPYKGFNASYQQACGGVLVGDVGVVQSPNYPNSYPDSTECDWDIVSTLGSNMTLIFETPFEIKNTNGQCEDSGGDYLMLLNGRDLDSPPLNPGGGDGNGKYCGNTAPQGLGTSSNGLFVRFKTNGGTNGAGFKFTYTSRDAACGSRLILTDDVTSLTFTSPNYPNPYPQGLDCYWIISCPATEAVQLDFLEFHLEQTEDCTSDFVLVVDGHTGDGPVLGRFCGADQPPTTKSSNNEMIVRLRTDAYAAAYGFSARYSIAACGGTLVGTGGNLTSPNYPLAYPVSTTCEWVIRGPQYHFLSFTFNSLNLSFTDSQTCGDRTGDYVEIRSHNFTGPILKTVCGVFIPIVVETLENVAYVRFVSDGEENVATGFSMNYIASEDACGADLNNDGGTISTPNYPNAYDHSRICTWNIVVPEDRSVTLVFNAFRIEDPYEDGICYWDYVEVFNGINPNSPSLSDRRCGGEVPPPYQSTGNTMRVVFSTDASLSNGGFLATYDSDEAKICGGVLNQPGGGNFTSPNYPSPYNNRMECIWTIENPNPANSTTMIKFYDFALEDHVICDYDRLHFRTGSRYDGFPISTFCGRTIPQPFGVAFPETFVQFISDPYTTDKGFFASYSFTTCGGLVVGTTGGVITSPNFPEVYDDNDYCLWTIVVAEDHKINMNWTNFEIELHNNCEFDYLKLFNGPSVDSPLIGTYCGDNQPKQFQSGSNTVTLLFQSDVTVSRGGWRMEWSETNSDCGNVIYHDHSGTVKSPGYPGDYPPNVDCIWQIIVDPAYHVEVTFDEDFYTELDDQCLYDFVALYDGIYEGFPEIQRFCGTVGDPNYPPEDPVRSSMQDMTVRFRSDYSTAHKGFKADWLAVCGQILTAPTGFVQSPNFPAAYINNEYCEFIITFPDNYTFIKLEFKSFQVEAGSAPTTCDYDYVQVFGGSAANAPLLGTFCGDLKPTSPLSSEGSMKVIFSTDPATIDYGFQATYESAQCGGLLTDTAGLINAFTHSDIHNNRNCTWQINVSPSEKLVELKFSVFDLEAHSSCTYDNVKVYDGNSTSAPLIGKYCGTRIPEYIVSTGPMMTIEYVTDDLITGDGFMAGYRAIAGPLEGCGGILTDTSGEFSTPDLDSDGEYDPNLNCLWLIQTPPLTIIYLEFTGFDLEVQSSPGVCGYDRVDVRDGVTEYDPLIMQVCGESLPVPYRSTGNGLYVRFVSDPIIQGAGFNATYRIENQTCGGNYQVTDSFQGFTSPPPNPNTQPLNCRWILDAGLDTSSYIHILWGAINLVSPSNPDTGCTETYVELRDYPLGDYGQVIRYCGTDLPPDFYSFGQIVQINFRTDSAATGKGFKFQYILSGCERNRTQNEGQIFSPGWPDPYVHNLNCKTIITVDPENEIQLFFNFFDVEFEDNCDFDHLDIKNGSGSDAVLLKRLCGSSLPAPVFLLSNEVTLELATDPLLVGKGYDITYTSSPNSCGGNIVGDHGSVYSKLYPQPYEPSTDCSFFIRTPANRPITVHITFIDIYYSCGDNGCACENDFLIIYAGPSLDSPKLTSYCGYGRLNDIKINNNGATVRLLTSDFDPGSRTNTGFRVDFES